MSMYLTNCIKQGNANWGFHSNRMNNGNIKDKDNNMYNFIYANTIYIIDKQTRKRFCVKGTVFNYIKLIGTCAWPSNFEQCQYFPRDIKNYYKNVPWLNMTLND